MLIVLEIFNNKTYKIIYFSVEIIMRLGAALYEIYGRQRRFMQLQRNYHCCLYAAPRMENLVDISEPLFPHFHEPNQ